MLDCQQGPISYLEINAIRDDWRIPCPAAYVWNPTEGIVERSNVTRFMLAHGISTYHELVSRSTADIAWFWQAVVEDLGIQFFRPYDTLLDLSRGVPWSRWFIGGADKPRRSLPRSARPVRTP